MSTHNFEGESSVSESIRASLPEIHALSNPASASSPGSQPSGAGAPHGPDSSTTALVFSSSDDIFDVLRRIQSLYGRGGSEPSDRTLTPRSIVAHQSGNSEPDGGDDLETLREIQKRFHRRAILEEDGDGSKVADGVRGKHIMIRADVNSCDHAADYGEKRICMSRETAKSVMAIINAIAKNRSAQEQFRGSMLRVEERTKKLKMIMIRMKILMRFHARMRSARLGDRQKFTSADGIYGPQENSRVVYYRMACQKYPQRIPRAKWTTADRHYLQSGVVQQFQKSLPLKTIDQGSEASGPVAMIGGVEVNLQALMSFLPNINWDELASTYLPGRSGPECQTRWINHEDPLINREEWTREEDKGILKYVRKKGPDFIAIADALGTNRTPFACLARYQRSLNPHLTRSAWTPAEDAELTAAVERYGESNWTVVASALEGRTAPQCSNRWLKSLLPSKQKKGKWEPHEDMRLKIAVRLMGKCWNKIAEFVPGRTQASCRERWVNCLDPEVNHDKWSEEEDRKLEEVVKVHGYCWTKVASCIPRRTDSHCRRRWKALFPNEAGQHQTARRLRKALLPSNFVDREAHRPTLEASDFRGLGGADEDDLTLAELKKSLKKRKRELKNLQSKSSAVTDGNVQDPPDLAANRAHRTRIKPQRLDDYLPA